VKKALKFIRSEQEPDGSWFGRWGVNYVYGTMQVLRGLQAMDIDDHEPYVQQARNGFAWCRTQTADGAKPAAPTMIRTQKASARVRRRKPPGRSWACSLPTTLAATPSRAALPIFSKRRKKTAPGTNPGTPAPVSPRLLSDVSHVQTILPVDRADDVQESDDREELGAEVRLP